jgi:hypothetical protein
MGKIDSELPENVNAFSGFSFGSIKVCSSSWANSFKV